MEGGLPLMHTQANSDSAMIASVFEDPTDASKSGEFSLGSRAPSELCQNTTPGLNALRDLLRGITAVTNERPLCVSTSVDRLRSRTGTSKGGIHRSTPKSWTGPPNANDDSNGVSLRETWSSMIAGNTGLSLPDSACLINPSTEKDVQPFLARMYPTRGMDLVESATSSAERVGSKVFNRAALIRRQKRLLKKGMPNNKRVEKLNVCPAVLDPLGEIRTSVLTPRVAYEAKMPMREVRRLREDDDPAIALLAPRQALTQSQLAAITAEADIFGEQEKERDRLAPPSTTAPLSVVKDWLESFTREEKGFDSLSIFFETRLREALVQTGQVGMPVPNRARAAMCCDLLLKVPRVFGRYAPLVTHLVDEVLRCVYKDYGRIERRMANGTEAGEQSKVDAQRLFREPVFFDLSETMRKKAIRLQEELNELTEGAGLVKLFRDRFLLWDGRNLLLRQILFRGWLRYSRMMHTGRRRLRCLRLQYWFDRYWEGLEREREEREAFERAAADAAALTNFKKNKASSDRRKTRMTRRASTVLYDGNQSPGSSFGIISDVQHASDVALKFLGLANNRAKLAKAIADEKEDKTEGEEMTAKDVLECLVDVMEESGIRIGGPTALTEDFATKIGFFPMFGVMQSGETIGRSGKGSDFRTFLAGRVEHMSFLAFGCEENHGPKAAFAAIQQWIESQKPPFPTSEDLQWLQKEFGMRSDGSFCGRKTKEIQGDDGTLSPGGTLAVIDEDGNLVGGSVVGLFSDKHVQTDESAFEGNGKTTTGGKARYKGKGARAAARGMTDDDGFGGGGRGGRGGRHGGNGGDDDSFGGDGIRKGKNEDSPGGIKDKDATSNVAISSVCQLIPLLYDRLIDVCAGSVTEAMKVKVQELGKHALIRRFGIKSIAINYFNGLMRTVKLCTDRELRIKLFCVVFSIEPEKLVVGAKKKGRSVSTTLDEDRGQEVQRRDKLSKREEVERRQRSAGVIAIFCDLWHNYFNSLQVIEATKMQQEKLNTRRRVREKSRVNRLSEFKLAQEKHSSGALVPPSKLYEQFLRTEEGPRLSPYEAANSVVPILKKISEFSGCRPVDIDKMASRMEKFNFPGDTTMLRQGDSTTPAALIIVMKGSASVHIRAGVPGPPSNSGQQKEDYGQLVKTLEAPFVVGEGRMLTGAPANATIIAGKEGVQAVILRVFDWDELMDENNTALKGLEVNAVQRAEERTKASGLSVTSEKISIYRSFFTDVDVNRTGRVNLSELLEAIQSKGTSVSMRDVEKAFKSADKDGDLELEFDEFIIMCDNLLRRGKRLFEQKRVSDVLVDLSRSHFLLEAFYVAIERTWKHTASHEPRTYAELQRRIGELRKERIDASTFMQSPKNESKGLQMKAEKSTAQSKKKKQEDQHTGELLTARENEIKAQKQKDVLKNTGPGVIVVNADEALNAAMDFWEAEHEAKGKLARIMSARNIIGRLVSRWLKAVRQKAVDRQAWHNFLRHYSDQKMLHRILVGSVQYDEFVDLIEEAYGLPITDTLGTVLFSDFEDYADKIATTSDEAIEAGRIHLIKQVATLRAQLWFLRTRSKKISGREKELNITRRSRMVILLYIVKSYVEGGLEDAKAAESGDMETNAKVAELLLSARTFEVNADAAFCALQARGIRIGKNLTIQQKQAAQKKKNKPRK